MEMEYVTAIIAFLATSLGVLGKIHTRNGKGLRRLAKHEYGALILALGALSVSLVQTHTNRSTQALREAEAQSVLVDALDQVAGEIYWSDTVHALYGLPKAAEGLQSRLTYLGQRVGKIVELYKERLTDDQKKMGFRIHVLLTEHADHVASEVQARDYLESLNSQISSLVASTKSNIMKQRKVLYAPLTDFVFDFKHPEPDQSLK